MVVSQGRERQAVDERGGTAQVGEQHVENGRATNARVVAGSIQHRLASEGQARNDQPPDGQASGALDTGRTLRVPAERVDLLIGRMGELLTVRNQLDHFLGQVEAAGVGAGLTRRGRVLSASLGRTVDDLQRTAMELRLVRLETVFRRLPRICRDAAAHTAKDVRLELLGGDTEVDKTVAEALADPLLHLLRNAVDHGIERPGDRQARGKSPAGTIIVAARAEAAEVIITVRDDGRGLDLARVRERAIERGLLDAATAAELCPEGVIDLLFQPGFSTAATVTDVSGRGVGLDVVRANVRRLGGAVTVHQESPGLLFELRFPVRLAATDVVLVRAAGQTFAVTLAEVRETLSVPYTRIRQVAGRPAIVQHGRVAPLVTLVEALGITPATNGTSADCARRPTAAHADQPSMEVLLTTCGSQTVGLIVDEIGRHQQVATRQLEPYLASPGLSGATVLGDGSVVLVIAPHALMAQGLPTAVGA
jgi:two-component system chemotaxis sensor kinase CheA